MLSGIFGWLPSGSPWKRKHANLLNARKRGNSVSPSLGLVDLWLPLAGFPRQHPTIEFRRLPARHAQRLPLIMLEVLGQEHNLSTVVGVMSNLAIDGLHQRMGLSTNGHRPLQILLGQCLQRS